MSAARAGVSISEKVTHKLSFEQAQEIRWRVRFGESQSAVGRAYGVTQAAVWAILNGKAHAGKRRPAMTPDEYRAHRRKRRRMEDYGLSPQDWEAMLEKANYSCEICGLHISSARPHPRTGEPFLVCDHDHDSGAVRGVLCSGCNTALGMSGDSVERLSKMVRYLERHGKVL